MAAMLAACGRPQARLQHARDLALAGHHKTALLEARAILLTLRDERGQKVDAVRRGTLKLAGDLCAVYLDDPRCAASEYRELVKRYPTSAEAFEARVRLGDLDMRIGNVKGALEAWRDQVASAPDRPGADAAQMKIARGAPRPGPVPRRPHSRLRAAAAMAQVKARPRGRAALRIELSPLRTAPGRDRRIRCRGAEVSRHAEGRGSSVREG